MSANPQRSLRSGRQQQQSLFYRDLASPISAHRGGGRFATPGQAAAVSALWRENFAAAAEADPPPPPAFTLDDRADFSPEPELGDLPPASPASTPPPPSPFRIRMEDSGPRAASGGSHVNHVTQQQQQTPTPVSSNWWSPVMKSGDGRSRDQEEKGKGSPVEGVVQPSALIMLPPPREVARPELQRDSLPPAVGLDEEWVTVYGFSPGDTNLVLREFEKCGVILKHVPGPRDSNWMHILYQNRYDAQKALHKSGVQIHSVLIVGVKAVDPAQRQILNETLSNSGRGGFMVSLPPKPFASRSTAASPSPMRASLGPTAKSEGAIATPSKSVVSKVMDLMFGI